MAGRHHSNHCTWHPLLGAPVVAHAISSTAYRIDIPFGDYFRNDLIAAEPGLDEDAVSGAEPSLPR